MLLEELTQEDLDDLLARATQRSVFAACIAGIMQLDLTSREGLAIKSTLMQRVLMSMEMGFRVHDEIDDHLLVSMKNHCEEQIEISELLDIINL